MFSIAVARGRLGFSREKSVNVEDGGEDNEQDWGAKGFPSSEDSLDAEGCVPGAEAIEGGEQQRGKVLIGRQERRGEGPEEVWAERPK